MHRVEGWVHPTIWAGCPQLAQDGDLFGGLAGTTLLEEGRERRWTVGCTKIDAKRHTKSAPDKGIPSFPQKKAPV